jgi:cytochrome P450
MNLEVLSELSFDVRIRTFFEYLDGRRALAAVGPSEQPGVWEVFGADEAVRVLTDHETYSSDVNAYIPAGQQQLAAAASGHLAGIDPPRHTELRGLINTAFTPRVVTNLEPHLAQTATALLDAVAERAGTGEQAFDLVDDFAAPLTATTIAELFGIPDSDHTLFARWAATLLNAKPTGSLGVADEAAMRRVGVLLAEVAEYLGAHIRARRAHPGEDLTSNLTTAEVAGRRLGDDEILGVISMFLLAGYLPGSILIGNLVMCLDEHPAVRDLVWRSPELVPGTIEEVLRWRPPLVRDQRITTRDAEIAGVVIPARSPVCVWVASANRDGAWFDRPAEFDIHRKPARHLALGKGIHYCLGAALTRLEARVAVAALAGRFERVTVHRGGGIEFHRPIGLLGPAKLPVTADPVRAGAHR